MRQVPILLIAACLGGCGYAPDTSTGHRQGGRYHGIGIYSPGAVWERIAGAGRTDNPQAATLRDDEQVIVVVDSETGEVRQCGNLSGHCIRMNPWEAQRAPVNVTEHQADPDRAAEEEAAAAANSSGR